MTPEQETTLLIRGAIASLPEAEQEEIRILAGHIRDLVANASVRGPVALALVGAEMAEQV